MRATGLYESVKVVGSTFKVAEVSPAAPDDSFNPADVPEPTKEPKSLDDH